MEYCLIMGKFLLKWHAESEFEKYRKIQDVIYESDFDRFMELEDKMKNDSDREQ